MSKIKDTQKATATTEEKYVKISWSNALDKVYAQKKKKRVGEREGGKICWFEEVYSDFEVTLLPLYDCH